MSSSSLIILASFFLSAPILVRANDDMPPPDDDNYPHVEVRHSDTILYDAIEMDDAKYLRGYLDTLPTMIKFEEINDPSRNGVTPAVQAALRGCADCLQALIDHGADLSIGENDGYTVAHAAAFRGNADVITVLAKAGVDLREKHSDGYEPIIRASWGSDERFVNTLKAFFNAGVEYSKVHNLEGKPFFYNVKHKYTPVYNFLLKKHKEAFPDDTEAEKYEPESYFTEKQREEL